tara:strand:- start:6037 stop:6417 length:381 start_codon:yes stop_codon:yes gene_type:complete
MNYPNRILLQKSGIIFAFLFSLVFSIFPFIFHRELKIFPLAFSAIVLLLGIFSPYKLLKPYMIWVKFGNLLGKFNSKVILGLFFYALITPFAIFRNIVKNILRIRKTKKSNSVNINSNDLNLKDLF